MAKFAYLFTGGSMAATPEEQAKIMQEWGAWFGELGPAIVDGGNPFGASASMLADGTVTGSGASGLGGYTLITAESLADATSLAKGCPVLAGGGTVEIYEALDM